MGFYTGLLVMQTILTVAVMLCDYFRWKPLEPKPKYFKHFWRTWLMLGLFVVDCGIYGFMKGIGA
jgi:hypothetical protein